MLARAVADGVREPEQDDDEDREQEQRRRVVRQPLPEAHHAVLARRTSPRRSPGRARAARSRTASRGSTSARRRPRRRRARRGRRTARAGSRASTAARRSLPAPKRVPTASVAMPITQASPASAAAATRNTATGLSVREVECAGDDAQPENPGEESCGPPAKAGRSPFARTSPRASLPRLPVPSPRPARAAAAARLRSRATPRSAAESW